MVSIPENRSRLKFGDAAYGKQGSGNANDSRNDEKAKFDGWWERKECARIGNAVSEAFDQRIPNHKTNYGVKGSLH